MTYLRSELLFHDPLVRVFDVDCHAPAAGSATDEWCSETQIILPRRGVFIVSHEGSDFVADPNTALLLRQGDTFRMSHPVDGGDRCTVLVFDAGALEEAIGEQATRHARTTAATQLGVAAITLWMATGAIDAFQSQDGAFLVLASLALAFRSSPSWVGPQVGAHHRPRVEQVRALLASHPAELWNLESVARTVHVSPFHLARQFRALTGESISHYLLRLRLALALDRIAQGEDDLARLAVDLGFAHHSHFTARFKRLFGLTPSAARTLLTRSLHARMRKIVTAASGFPR